MKRLIEQGPEGAFKCSLLRIRTMSSRHISLFTYQESHQSLRSRDYIGVFIASA